MNYLVLNGIKSNTVKGLLIQSLPPISKPLLRTEVIEIDGRDGDITNDLGYSAYDREVTIGLHGDFNIDNVINYFNGSGEVIFSNEPEKKYRYKIIEQIDYERLIRYRTATVTFHVQPFKLSATQAALTFDINKQIKFQPYEDTTAGITVKIIDGVLTVAGTATRAESFDVPVNVALPAGDYTMIAVTSGTVGGCAVTLTNGSDNIGPLTLDADDAATIQATLDDPTTFDTLTVSVPSGATVDLSVQLSVFYDDLTSVVVSNVGNTFAKPVIEIQGTGTINLYLNGSQVFVIDAGIGVDVVIDVENMESYSGNILMNRYVTGNFENFVLPIGHNEISWSGTVTQFKIKHYSRWI